MKAAIYIRVSSQEQKEKGYSLDAQVDFLIERASKDGIVDYEVYADEGISGRKTENRPEYNRMVADIENGDIDVVYTHALSRIARSTIDGVRFITWLQNQNVQLVSISEQLDTSTPHGMFSMRLLFSLAELESDMVSKRTKDVLRSKKDRGQRYSRPIFGLDEEHDQKDPRIVRLVPNQKEAYDVKRIFLMRSAQDKISYAKIAERLNDTGSTTKHGKRWSQAAVKRVIDKEKLYEQHKII